MPIQIQYRRGTAAQWTSANPVLAAGEPGYETDTGRFKIGNGTNNWSALSYSSGIQGVQGTLGTQGPSGGPQGTTGAQGTLGNQGTTGAGTQGTIGIQGFTGTSGSTVAVDSAIATRFLTFADATSGSVTMYTSPGITANASSNNITVVGSFIDGKGDVRDIPLNSQTSAYILISSDVGKVISITTGGVTVPNTIFSAGDVVSVYNNSAGNQTLTQGVATTMYLAGTATTGNRTLAQRGVATVLCVAANTFVISGSGLT